MKRHVNKTCIPLSLSVPKVVFYADPVSRKSKQIAALIENHRGHDLDAHYLGYIECFNRQLYYEAHDVLEELWLANRWGVNGSFYKGLIQLAGAFVHLQKDRLHPAARLLQLARTNLGRYSPVHERLDVARVMVMIEDWLSKLEFNHFSTNPLVSDGFPAVCLLERSK